jgi:hypothetical protein
MKKQSRVQEKTTINTEMSKTTVVKAGYVLGHLLVHHHVPGHLENERNEKEAIAHPPPHQHLRREIENRK